MTAAHELDAVRARLRGRIAALAQAGLDNERYEALFGLVARHWPEESLYSELAAHRLSDRAPFPLLALGSPAAIKVANSHGCTRVRRVHSARVREHYELLYGTDSRWKTLLTDSLGAQWSTLLGLWLCDSDVRMMLGLLCSQRVAA